MPKKLTYLLLFLILNLWSCSSQKAKQEPAIKQNSNHVYTYGAGSVPLYNISFKKVNSYGTTSKQIVLVGGGDDAVVDNKGRVYIPDRKQQKIFVFSPDGHIITHLGRRGKGRGEFDIIAQVKIASGHLYATDTFQPRINIYSLDSLSFSRMILLNPEHWKHIKKLQNKGISNQFLFPINNGKMLVSFYTIRPPKGGNKEQPKRHYYWMRPDGDIIGDEVLQQKTGKKFHLKIRGSSVDVGVWHFGTVHPRPLTAVSGNGMIFAAWSKDFTIKEYDTDGDYIRSIHYKYKNAPLNKKKYIKSLFTAGHESNDRFEIALRHAKFPQTWPALHSIKLDNKGRIWVSTIVKNPKVNQWWVMTKKENCWPGSPGRRINLFRLLKMVICTRPRKVQPLPGGL